MRVIETKITKPGRQAIRDHLVDAYNSLIDPEFILEKWAGIDSNYIEIYSIVKSAQVYTKLAMYELDKLNEEP